MPSGPSELHERWKSDGNACDFLEAQGLRMTRSYDWVLPEGRSQLTPDEASALTYLQLEWDYGGLITREQAKSLPGGAGELVPLPAARLP